MPKHVIEVPVFFQGVVDVEVPGNISIEHAKILAEKVALGMILATVDNSDADMETPCEEFEEETGLSETVFDEAKATGVGGRWTTGALKLKQK